MSLSVFEGNILQASETYVLHQINCRTTNSKGLARVLFKAYPWADIYTQGKIRVPGHVYKSIGPNKVILHLAGQDIPGKPDAIETATQRLAWFKHGLKEVPALVPFNARIAIPYGVGCGLAGGDWLDYEKAIFEWLKENPTLSVVLYRM